MRGPLSVDARRQAHDEDPRWHTKAVLRVVATFFSLLAMCLFAAAISYTNANFVNTMGNGDWSDGLALAPVRVSLSFSLKGGRVG